MKSKTSIGIMLTLPLMGILTSAFNIQPVRASGIIYIRADGSVDPSTAPVQRNGALYTLTGNIITDADGIVIQRNNITLDGAGYTVQGTGAYPSKGLHLSERNNVTIKNVKVELFFWGIRFESGASNNSIIGNSLANNEVGILLYSSSNYNSISENNITNNDYGIFFVDSSNNEIYHNNFVGNTLQVYVNMLGYSNLWDDGYPSGGNYWSDYTGVDEKSGPGQDQPGSDSMGDTPYIIDADNVDRYPLVNPWTPTPPIIPATVDINPDTLNLRSKGQWITAYIELPEGYNVSDIDVSTIMLNDTISISLL